MSLSFLVFVGFLLVVVVIGFFLRERGCFFLFFATLIITEYPFHRHIYLVDTDDGFSVLGVGIPRCSHSCRGNLWKQPAGLRSSGML